VLGPEQPHTSPFVRHEASSRTRRRSMHKRPQFAMWHRSLGGSHRSHPRRLARRRSLGAVWHGRFDLPCPSRRGVAGRKGRLTDLVHGRWFFFRWTI
jgi:hypothetical protein